MALTPWKPGQSGNLLGGSAPAIKLAAYVRSLAGQDGKAYLDILHGIATGAHRDTKTRVTALQMLLDRGWGKPREHVTIDGQLQTVRLTPEALARLSDDDLHAAISVAMKLREAVSEASGTPQDASTDAPPMDTLPASSAVQTTTQGPA